MKQWIRCAAAVSLALAAAGPALAQSAATAPPAIAALDYETRTLANGLKVYSLRDPSSANVSIQVWYDVGSRDDPRGRSGFAHLFEHLMFKSTRNLVPEQLDRLTEDVGGFNNASTADDYTNYFEVVPANHLQRLLWAEAERMQSLVIEPGFFASERDVVKEEFRSRVLAAPYGKLFYLYLPQISYDVHPYARPGIGSIEDLDAATIDDVRAFHASYYRPDNAVLVVAGNFDQPALDGWVDRYFAPIARPSTPIARVTAREPERSKARSFTVYEPNTPLPAVMLTYPVPPAADADAAAVEMLDAILSRGESSRLHQSLVYRDRVASQTSSFLDVKQGRGVLAAYAILGAGQTAATGEAGLRREMARFRDEHATPAEIEEARRELLTAALRERETVDGRADALAEAVILVGDAAAADRRLARIAAVTAADIQHVARTWLREERSAAVRYLPEDAQKGAREDVIATSATVQTAALTAPANIRIWEPAPESERVAPPPPGPEVTPAVPKPTTQRLANGLTLVTVENHSLPLVTASLVARGGSAADADGRAGTAQLAAEVLTEGTKSRSATDIDRAVEALGASLDSGAGWDGSRVSFTLGARQLDQGVAILADLAQNATLASEEIDRKRSLAIDGVAVAMSDPGQVAQLTAMRALYGGSAYGHPASGTASSLKSIARADVEGAYRTAWTPANVTLVLSGDIAPAQARALAERHFGTWAAPRGEPVAASASAAGPLAGKVIIVDMPGSGQAAVLVARNGLARSDPRYFQALVANAVLGGGYSARLNQEIRIKRGLSYGSRSAVDARRHPGPFFAVTQTRNDAADQVLALTLTEMRRLGTEPLAAADLEARRATLVGGFGRGVETTSGMAGLIADSVQRGLAPDAVVSYLPSVLAVSSADARAAAAALMLPAGSTIVIAGDAKQFADRLRATYPDLVVIPVGELDLGSAALR